MANDRSKPSHARENNAAVSVGPVIKGLSREAAEELSAPFPDVEVSLKERLTALRTDRGITQSELARRLGRSRATVNQYEKGGIEPPLKTVEMLADVLTVDPAYLAFGSSSPSPLSSGRIDAHGDGLVNDYVEFSHGLSGRLKIVAATSEVVEVASDAPEFGLRRGDFIVVDVTKNALRGDGRLYAVRTASPHLTIVRTETQLVDDVERLRVTLTHGQASDVDGSKVEVAGLIVATIRQE